MSRFLRVWLALSLAASLWIGSALPARADPITTAIVAFAGLSGTVAAVATFVINTALYTAASWAAGKLMGKSKASVQERQASVTTLSLGETPREALIGETATGGSLIDAFNHGGQYSTDTVVRCIALADHAVDGLVGYFVDDQYYAFSANGVQAGFSGKLDIEFVNATAAGAAPPARFLAASAGTWDVTDVLAGVTHVWVATTIDDKVWTQGHPQFRFVTRGLKVYDPRKDPALGYVGPGPQTWADRSTHSYSRNAALLRYAFVRGVFAEGHHGEIAHLLIGRGLTATEAPPERIIAAANVCDEDVDGTPRYRANGVIRASDDFIVVEEMFAAAMAGVIVQREGGVEVEPGQAKSAVVTITDGDLVVGEQLTFSEFLPDGDGGRINTVIPRYVEPAQNWKDHAGPVRRDLDDITDDGGPRELTLPLMLVTDGGQADRCAEITRRLARLERRATIVLPPDHAELEEGDWIAWTSDRRHGGATVTYRIESWSLDEKWRQHLSLREIAATAYGEGAPVTDGSDTPPGPVVPGAVALVSVAASATSLTGAGATVPGIRATWTAPVDPAIRAIRAEVRVAGGADIAPTGISDPSTGVAIVTAGVVADEDVEIRLVPITDDSRAVTASAWIPLTIGSLVVPITPTIADDYNLLRRTGGGNFTGDLTSTEGARAGGNLFRTDGVTVMTQAEVRTPEGQAATIAGQTAWATSPLAIARLNNLSDTGLFNDLSNITTRPLTALTGRTANNLTYVSGGATVESLRPGEFGANVTETRQAATILGQAATATSSDFAVVTGATRPSDNAGTSGVLTAIGSGTVITGNVVTKPSGTTGYHGAAVGLAQAGSAFVQSSITGAGGVGALGWSVLALGEDATTFDNSGRFHAELGTASSSTGTVYLYESGVLRSSAGLSGLTAASRFRVAYDGAAASVVVDGVRVLSIAAPAGLRLWPKVIPYGVSTVGQMDVQYGAYSQAPRMGSNTYGADGVTLFTQAQQVTAEGQAATVVGQTAWATSPLAIARLNNLSDTGLFNDLSNITTRPLTALTGRTANNLTYVSGGATVESLRPGEFGANVTETRQAATILGQAATATSSDFAVVTGATRPSDNAGTSGVLTAIGSGTVITGNVVTKPSGTTGYHGAAVGLAQAGSAFVQSSITGAGGVGALGWSVLALGEDATTFDNSGRFHAELGTASSSTGTVYLYESGVLRSSAGLSGLTAASRFRVAYDGAAASVVVDGVRVLSIAAPAGLRLWPKVIPYGVSTVGQMDVQYGAYSQAPRMGSNTYGADGVTLFTQAQQVTAEGQAATVVGQGPLVTSPLTETEVRGRHAGDFATIAAATAGMNRGDVGRYMEFFPPGPIARLSDGTIQETGQRGRKLPTTATNTNSLAAGATAIYCRQVIPNVQSESTVKVSLGIITSNPMSRSGSGSVQTPSGTYAIKEKASGAADNTAQTIHSGTWSTLPEDIGSTALNSITLDDLAFANGLGVAVGLPSRDIPTGATLSREWFVSIANTATGGSGGLVNFGVRLDIRVERTPII